MGHLVLWGSSAAVRLVVYGLCGGIAGTANALCERRIHRWRRPQCRQALGSINDALQKARKGDVVVVAPGEYQESIRVLTAGITVQGSVPGETEPQVVVAAPAGKPGPVLRDGADTVWRGVAFRVADRAAVTLRGFTGRFEYCLFSSDSPVPGIEVSGGSPVFQGCTFIGGVGPAAHAGA